MIRAFILVFVLISGVGFAQKKNAPVFVVGRIISADDSVKVKQYFYEGLIEKTKQNFAESGRYFKQIIEIDPSNDGKLLPCSKPGKRS